MKDFFWFVGLFEGEGCIGVDKADKNRPSIELAMQDRDVMERVSKLLDHKIVSFIPPGKSVKGKSYKEMHRVRIYGRKAVMIIDAMKPHMSSRRRVRMEEALSLWQPKVTYTTESYTPRLKKEIIVPLLIQSNVVTLNKR